MNFQRFREVCYSLNCGEHVTELWQELDPNRGGCISLWELDPESVALIVKLRTRMLSVLASEVGRGRRCGGVFEDVEETDANVLFARLTSHVRPVQLGSLEQHEFRLVAKPLGLSMLEADKAFACLDHYPGSTHAPPASIDVTDIQWLKKLVTLVDTDAVACAQDVSSGMQPPFISSDSPSTAMPPPVDPRPGEPSPPASPDTGKDYGFEESQDEDFEDDDEQYNEDEEEEEEFDEDEEEEDEDEAPQEETW